MPLSNDKASVNETKQLWVKALLKAPTLR